MRKVSFLNSFFFFHKTLLLIANNCVGDICVSLNIDWNSCKYKYPMNKGFVRKHRKNVLFIEKMKELKRLAFSSKIFFNFRLIVLRRAVK